MGRLSSLATRPVFSIHSDSKGNLDFATPTIRIRREKRGIKDKINLPEISSDVLINSGRKQLEKEVEMFQSLLQIPVSHYSTKPGLKGSSSVKGMCKGHRLSKHSGCHRDFLEGNNESLHHTRQKPKILKKPT